VSAVRWRERGLTYMPANAGEYVSGRLAGVASLVSGRFAMIDDVLGFQLLPWQPSLEKHIGRQTVRLIFRLAREVSGSSGPMGVKSIATHLNATGIRTRDSGRWGVDAVHKVLTRTTT
jgi:hypothetical protein